MRIALSISLLPIRAKLIQIIIYTRYIPFSCFFFLFHLLQSGSVAHIVIESALTKWPMTFILLNCRDLCRLISFTFAASFAMAHHPFLCVTLSFSDFFDEHILVVFFRVSIYVMGSSYSKWSWSVSILQKF